MKKKFRILKINQPYEIPNGIFNQLRYTNPNYFDTFIIVFTSDTTNTDTKVISNLAFNGMPSNSPVVEMEIS